MPRRLLHRRSTPPYKTAGLVLIAIVALLLGFLYGQFRGAFTEKVPLTLVSDRAGLVLDPGSRVTYNGVEIGKVARIEEIDVGGVPKARVTVDVHSRYIELIPTNVNAEIMATTVFGNKYVAFSSPKEPAPQHISSDDVIGVSGVTTEFNNLFETVLSVAEQVDPIKLNQTLTATAEALDGLGDNFGRSLVDGNEILVDLNPRLPQVRYDAGRLAELTEIYGDAAPDLFDALENAVTTAGTLNQQQADLDRALMASIGLGNTGSDILERGGPYLIRGAGDLIPTTAVLDYYSPALFCTIRNYHDVEPKLSVALGGNGYSGNAVGPLIFPGNPYVYPDNLPRVNARGGPEGRPGCWQKITRDLFPAPYLVMDTGASIAPYNHFELGQPILLEYVWGRQIGEYTINP